MNAVPAAWGEGAIIATHAPFGRPRTRWLTSWIVSLGESGRKMKIVSLERSRLFVAPGAALLGIAALLAYHLARSTQA